MKLITVILTYLAIATETASGQAIKKCDLTFLVRKKIGQLTQDEIRDFLLTFDKDCKNNVEYSEGSNELLFTILNKQTELTLLTLKKNEKSVSWNIILNEFADPIHDGFDLKDLIKKVEKATGDTGLKMQVVDNLKIADNKLN